MNRNDIKMNKKKSEKELIIELDLSSLESQINRLAIKFDLTNTEAENISKEVRKFVEVKVKERNKKYSETVIDELGNFMVAMLIEIVTKLKCDERESKILDETF